MWTRSDRYGGTQVVDGAKSKQRYFEVDSEFEVKLLEDGGKVMKPRGSGNNMSG